MIIYRKQGESQIHILRCHIITLYKGDITETIRILRQCSSILPTFKFCKIAK